MGRPVLKIRGYTAEQIKSMIRKDERYTVGLRLYAVYQVALGQPSRKLEELYNTSYSQIINWVHRFEKQGVEGLKDKEGRGRHIKLAPDQVERLKQLIVKESPENYGYNSGTWNGPILREWIIKHFGIEYKRSSIYLLLKEIGYSYQKSKGVYPETDMEQIGRASCRERV